MTASAPPAPTSPPVPIPPLAKLALLALFMAADRIEVAIQDAASPTTSYMYRDPGDLVADVNALCQLAAAQDWGLTT